MKCPNCDEEIKETWKVCPSCTADLTKRKYSRSDDPLEKLKTKVDKIDEFLTEKFPVTDGGTNVPKGKRKTLFGD